MHFWYSAAALNFKRWYEKVTKSSTHLCWVMPLRIFLGKKKIVETWSQKKMSDKKKSAYRDNRLLPLIHAFIIFGAWLLTLCLP